MKLLWLTDPHLDHADSLTRSEFFSKLRSTIYDAVVITGDISVSRFLARDLVEIAKACAPRNVYFVLGNHDFFGTSLDHGHRIAESCCQKHANLHQLGGGEIVRLGADTALIGHRGWADGRAYGGRRVALRFPDQDGIADFRFRSTYPAFRKMEELGRESGAYFRQILPYALTCYRQVVIATHVPVVARAAQFHGKPCGRESLPHFVNATAGAVIQRVVEHFPNRKITVLCGHAHYGTVVQISPSLEVRVGQARKGDPSIQAILDL